MKTTLDLPTELNVVSRLPLRERQATTLAILDSFMTQDEAEHQETLRVLRQALTEDRPGQRSVFGERQPE